MELDCYIIQTCAEIFANITIIGTPPSCKGLLPHFQQPNDREGTLIKCAALAISKKQAKSIHLHGVHLIRIEECL